MQLHLNSKAYEIILESISDGVFTVDKNWKITSFNRAAEKITGIKREEALGSLCCEVFRSNMCESFCALRETMKTGKPVINRSGFIILPGGDKLPISVSTSMLKDREGNIYGGVETFRDLSDVERLKKQIRKGYQACDLISASSTMAPIFEMIPLLSESNATVLITGETGTGKEILARAIHGSGTKKDRPFIGVNCSAIPENLLESEMFGYKKGAFTGASFDKPGKFQIAETGTLFLDEIGEISLSLQVKLLRVLQERVFEPLGSNESIPFNGRLITATNKNLLELVKKGLFREDLYYRIHVIPVEIPPLRKRIEDIPLLCNHFLSQANLLENRCIEGVSTEALSMLLAYNWPGNIRELENVVKRAVVVCEGDQIMAKHIPFEISGNFSKNQVSPLEDSIKLTEKQVIIESLQKNEFNVAKTAGLLNIHKATLYRKIKSLDIKLP